MIRTPRLKGTLSFFPLTETSWGLAGGGAHDRYVELTEEGALRSLGCLLPWLNGKYTIEEVLEGTEAAGGDREMASLLLLHLEELRCLEEGGDGGLPREERERFAEQIAYFSQFGSAGGAQVQKALRDSRVAVAGDGELARILSRQLAEAGVGDVVCLDRAGFLAGGPDSPLPGLLVMPQEAHDPELLEAINSYSLQRKVSWLLVRSLSVQEGWVGPLFIPGKTASYLSLEARLRGNLAFFPEYLAFDRHVRQSHQPGLATGGLRPNLELLGGIAVAEVVKLLGGYQPPSLAGRFLSINLMTWETEVHHVLRVPRLDEEDSPEYQKIPWKKVAAHG